MAGGSAAYDYSLFQTAEPAEKKELRDPKPQLRMVKTRKAAFSAAFAPRVLSAFVVVVTLLSLIVYNQVCLNEVTGEINALNNELSVLESENLRYASLMESTTNRSTVLQRAVEELRLDEPIPDQLVYIYLYEEDLIVASEPEANTGGDGVLAAIASAFEGLLEYISLL